MLSLLRKKSAHKALQLSAILNYQNVLDNLPINVICCDLENFAINYLNRTSRQTLQSIQHMLPFPVDQLEGQSIDIFHKNPGRIRAILMDPKNLPHYAKIKLGPDTMSLRVTGIFDPQGHYIGVLLVWDIISQTVKLYENFESKVKGVVDMVSSAATELHATAESLSQVASQVNQEAEKIYDQTQASARITKNGVDQAQKANNATADLTTMAETVGQIIQTINVIASRTNLLALNATIEAARAGDVGKGFAVVANEVKGLANQTAKATDEISKKIHAMQHETGMAAQTIGDLTSTMAAIQGTATEIASAVAEQNRATQASQQSTNEVLAAAKELAQQAETLRHEVNEFLKEIKSL